MGKSYSLARDERARMSHDRSSGLLGNSQNRPTTLIVLSCSFRLSRSCALPSGWKITWFCSNTIYLFIHSFIY